MKIIIPLIISTVAGLGTIIGSLLAILPIKNTKKFITTALAFSGSVMILISILDLLPPSIHTITQEINNFSSILFIILPFIIGVIIITVIDNKIEGESSLYKIGILSLIALIIHNFPEGIATFMTSYVNTNLGMKLSLAIMLHNIPEGICIAIPIAQATHSLKKGVGLSALSSIAEPLGALTAYILLKDHINAFTISIILIFVAGIMITLSINNIYKESLKYEYKRYFVLGVILSIIYIIITFNI